MKRPLIFLSAALLTLAGCSDNNRRNDLQAAPTPPPPPVATASLEVLHASPDAPAVNVLANGSVVLAEVPYKSGSGFLSVDEGEITLEVQAIIPGGNASVIGPATLPVAADERISVIAVGETAAIEPLVLVAPEADPAAGNLRLRVVHAAPGAPQVDVYATAPDAELATAAALGTFSFKEDIGPVEVPAGGYRIRVTLAGDADSVVFDSGALDLPEGVDLVIAAVQNTGPGAAPISLVVLDGTGAAELLDAATPAAVRVIHASPDAPGVDVVANDAFDARPVTNLEFPDFTEYLTLPAGDINFKVVPTGSTEPVVIDADVTLVAGFEYSVYAIGALADIEPLVLVDDNRRVATEARVRIVHGSPSAGEVDIYVTASGAGTDDVDPAFAGVSFAEETGYVSLAAGTYDVTVTGAGTGLAAIGPATLEVEAGGIYTAIARDEIGGGVPLGLILMDDLAAP